MKMAELIKANIKMMKNMGMESTHGLTGKFMKVDG